MSAKATFLATVERAWRALGDPLPGLVIACSGGPDSVALTRALVEVRGTSSVPLVLAHLNHLLRGPESDADERFVQELHGQLQSQEIADIHLVSQRRDMAALAQQEQANLESLARRERYRWLADVARSHGLALIATGHTASDQAETVLHRLLRGSGLDGLRGIAFRRCLEPGIEVVRPMLHLAREQVLAYLQEIGQTARHDSSNDDRHFTRNRIRHELLPLLQRDYNPHVAEALTRLAVQASEVFEAEAELARQWLERAEKPRAGSLVILDVAVLRSAPVRMVRAALRLLWQREGWPMGQMGFAEYERLANLVWRDAGAHDLPGRIRARRRGRVLQLGPIR